MKPARDAAWSASVRVDVERKAAIQPSPVNAQGVSWWIGLSRAEFAAEVARRRQYAAGVDSRPGPVRQL